MNKLFKTDKFINRLILALLIVVIAVIPLIYLPFDWDLMTFRTSIDEIFFTFEDTIYKPKLNALLSTLILLLVLIYIASKKGFMHKLSFDKEYKAVLIFLLLLITSTILSSYRWTAIYGRPYRWEGMLAYLAYIAVFFSFALLIKRYKDLKIITFSLMGSAAIISIYGFIQLFGLDFIARDLTRLNWRGRMFSTLGNPNFAGSYISMILPIALVLFLYAKNKKEYIITGLLSCLYYAFLIGTSTRGAWLTFVVMVILIAWFSRKRLKKSIKPVLFLFLIFIMITIGIDLYQGGYITRRIVSVFSDMEKIVVSNNQDGFKEIDKVGSNRIFIYRKSIPLLFKNPFFGSGLDTFDKVFPQKTYAEFTGTNTIVDKAHNEYLQLGVTAGIPALLVYLWLIVAILREGYSNLKKNNKFQQGLFLAMLAYLIQANFNISVVAVAPIFWSIIGLNVVINRILRKDNLNIQEEPL